ARHDEAVPVRVDDPEVADERLPRAVGPHLPRDGPRLSQHADPRLQLERSVVSDGERGHPASANDDLAQVSVWRDEDVVLQAGDVIAHAHVDTVVEPAVQKPGVRADVRSPVRRIVPDEEAVARASFTDPDEARGP